MHEYKPDQTRPRRSPQPLQLIQKFDLSDKFVWYNTIIRLIR